MSVEFVHNIGDSKTTKVNPIWTFENLIAVMICWVIALVLFRANTDNPYAWSIGGTLTGPFIGYILSMRTYGYSVVERIYLHLYRRIIIGTKNHYVYPHTDDVYGDYTQAIHIESDTIEFH